MSDYTEFYLSSSAAVVQLECFEISHSDFSQTYRIVRNNGNGCTVKHEDGISYAYIYVPTRITAASAQNDLDYSLKIDFGDLGEILPLELDRVQAGDGWQEKPRITYRTYRSDDLTAPIFGPIDLEVRTFTFNKTGCSFEAVAPSANSHATGMIYNLTDFPMLRGLL
jgi:Domain of unknown function (DUF1833)